MCDKRRKKNYCRFFVGFRLVQRPVGVFIVDHKSRAFEQHFLCRHNTAKHGVLCCVLSDTWNESDHHGSCYYNSSLRTWIPQETYNTCKQHKSLSSLANVTHLHWRNSRASEVTTVCRYRNETTTTTTFQTYGLCQLPCTSLRRGRGGGWGWVGGV